MTLDVVVMVEVGGASEAFLIINEYLARELLPFRIKVESFFSD